MCSKIFSRILLTVTTFLLLSPSLLALPMTGEGEVDSSDLTPRQNEARQQEENNRERAATTADVTSLLRSMDGFHIAAEAPTAASENKTTSLQAADLAGRSDAMEHISETFIPPGFNSVGAGGSPLTKSFSSPAPTLKQKLVQVDPDHASVEMRKRIFDADASISSTPKKVAIASFVTPEKTTLNAGNSEVNELSSWSGHSFTVMINDFGTVDETEQIHVSSFAPTMRGEEIATALAHAEHVATYAAATCEAADLVRKVFIGKDRVNKTDSLSAASSHVSFASAAVSKAANNLNDFHASSAGHSAIESSQAESALLLKYILATTALKEASVQLNAVAESLTSDAVYGSRVDMALRQIREVHAGHDALFATLSAMTRSLVVKEISFPSLAAKKEALNNAVQTAEATLEYGLDLIENVVSRAATVFGQCDEDEKGDWLVEESWQSLEEAAVARVAINNAKHHLLELESFSGTGEQMTSADDALIFKALEVTTDDAIKAIEQMHQDAISVEEHQQSWPFDVSEILTAATGARTKYEASFLGKR